MSNDITFLMHPVYLKKIHGMTSFTALPPLSLVAPKFSVSNWQTASPEIRDNKLTLLTLFLIPQPVDL